MDHHKPLVLPAQICLCTDDESQEGGMTDGRVDILEEKDPDDPKNRLAGATRAGGSGYQGLRIAFSRESSGAERGERIDTRIRSSEVKISTPAAQAGTLSLGKWYSRGRSRAEIRNRG